MATKWKSIIKKVSGILKEYRDYVLGGVLAVAGAGFFWNIIVYRSWHPTGEALFFGVIGNLLFGGGIKILLKPFLEKKSGNKAREDEELYSAWKRNSRMLEKYICIIGAAALLCAFWYMSYLMGGGVWQGGGWNYNYASGYIMIFTVFVQFIFAQGIVIIYMRKQLDALMETAAEENRRRVEEALEIERKSMEKVSRSDQLRVDLITNVSHDLKTPLTSMVGYIELIKKEELNDEVRDYIEVISGRADKLKEMINSLFNLAKASSGNVELNLEKFEVNRLIEQIFADMDDRIQESGLEFVMRLAKENTELVSDNSYFYRICQNLIENALKYSAKGTRAFVKTSVNSGNIYIEITNTSGYPMDFTKEDIVERFARGDKARSGDGNGLGLAIVSTYAKALGGEFDIRIDCDQFKACLTFPISKEKGE